MEKDLSCEVASSLLSIGAVFLRPEEPFVWASGIKSPIYCDNRLVLSDCRVRNLVEEGLSRLVAGHYPEAEILMGTATAGIAHAAIAAHILGLPMGYVRSSGKDHGRQNRIEGRLPKGAKAVVVEDLVSTAKSSIETVAALREAGADVLGMVSIFTYNLAEGAEALAKAQVENHSLASFDDVCRIALETGALSEEDVARLRRFQANPKDESWIGK